MKTLILIRHAKSDWGFEGLDDIDRPLNERGYRDAIIMRQYLLKTIPKIDLIVSSPAIRAFTTASMFARKYQYDVKEIVLDSSIYHSPKDKYVEAIRALNDKHEVVLVFGHNPGITDVVSYISDYEFENVATCGIVNIQFDLNSWKDVSDHSGKLVFYEFASNLT
jgi:phosphohistidine phosphatase